MERSTKKPRLDFTNVFTVEVGEKSQKFTVHEAVLKENSKLIQKLCMKPEFEGTRTIRLSDDSPLMFQDYLQWVYARDIFITVKQPYWMLAAVQMYLFADCIIDIPLKNAVLDKMVSHSHEPAHYLSPDWVSLAYSDTGPRTEPLRKFIKDLYRGSGFREAMFLKYCKHDWPEDFIFDLAIEAVSPTKKVNPAKAVAENKCYYHDHRDKSTKCKS